VTGGSCRAAFDQIPGMTSTADEQAAAFDWEPVSTTGTMGCPIHRQLDKRARRRQQLLQPAEIVRPPPRSSFREGAANLQRSSERVSTEPKRSARTANRAYVNP